MVIREEVLGVVLMRTSVLPDAVRYEVVAPNGVVHSEVVPISRRRGHEPGGRAFQRAAALQEKRAFEHERQARIERRAWLE
jgi:hypothetical protein